MMDNIKVGSGGLMKIALVVIGLMFAYGTFFVVPEGHSGILKQFGEAKKAYIPGLHFKWPIIDDIEIMETRTRKYSISLVASTTGRDDETNEVELQMPSKVKISANWNIPADATLAVYKEYGGLSQYEDRILDPRVIRATKQIFAKFSIEQVVSEREVVRAAIDAALSDALADKLAKMTDINIEDVTWSPKIKAAVEDKQTAKFAFEKEQYILDKQNLEAQQAVNTADAEAKGIDKLSIANAAATEREGLATAAAMEAKAKVLADNPQLVELIKAERWDGALPKVTSSAGMLMNMGNVKDL